MLVKYFKIIFCLSLMFALTSCNRREKADTTDIVIDFKFKSFEKDLFEKGTIKPSDVVHFKKDYGDFFKIFTTRIISIQGESDSAIAAGLNYFKNDADIKVVYGDVKKMYSNTGWLHDELAGVFKNYKYYYPAKQVPQVVTYISAFNYKNIRMDSVLGISLEFYLGADCIYYPSLNFPLYMTKHFTKDYIVRDCINSFYQTEYEQSPERTDLLSQMIYFGKMYYFSEMLAPQMHDTIRTGYSKIQFEWCKKNESKIWTALIENKLLFSNDFAQYNKFIAEGNTTAGFPEDAPASLGKWIGYQIVRMYMEKNPTVTLEKLMNESDAQKILNDSKYKPGRD